MHVRRGGATPRPRFQEVASAMRRVGAAYAGLAAATFYKLSHASESYDIDSGHDRWAAIVVASQQEELPSAYLPLPIEGLRYRFDANSMA
ncbi:unnamed protein product, partial [Polarella glacialis]